MAVTDSPTPPVDTRRQAETRPGLRSPEPRWTPSESGARRPVVELRGVAPAAEARDRAFRRLLVLTDLLAIAWALVLAIVVLGEDGLHPGAFLALPLVAAASKVLGLYDRDELLIRKTTIDEVPQLFQLTTLYTLLFWLLEGVFVDGLLGKEQVLALWASLFGLSVLGRTAARALARRSSEAERILFIGDASTYERLATKLEHGGVKAVIVGRMSLQRLGRSGPREADQAELRELIQWTDAHRIVIEPQALPAAAMPDFVRAVKAIGVRVSLIPRVFDVVGSSVVFDDVLGLTVLGVRRFGLSRSSRLFKRAFDLAGASLGLVVVAPLLLAIAVAIKAGSRGPVLFRQTRVGRDGERFEIYKFRTMCTDAEQRKTELHDRNEAGAGLFKIADDPRITRVGRWLRRTSLDELPQLLNVITGDMSLVGPRPLVVDEDSRITGFDRRRLQLTPGMTGHWQILGSSRIPLPEMVKIDYLYVASWSLWSDLKILLRTVPYVLSRRGL